jgi:hypothetical protein
MVESRLRTTSDTSPPFTAPCSVTNFGIVRSTDVSSRSWLSCDTVVLGGSRGGTERGIPFGRRRLACARWFGMKGTIIVQFIPQPTGGIPRIAVPTSISMS